MDRSALIALAAALSIAVSTIFPALGQGLAAKAAMSSSRSGTSVRHISSPSHTS